MSAVASPLPSLALDALSEDLLALIFSFLDFRDTIRAGLTCRQLLSASRRPEAHPVLDFRIDHPPGGIPPEQLVELDEGGRALGEDRTLLQSITWLYHHGRLVKSLKLRDSAKNLLRSRHLQWLFSRMEFGRHLQCLSLQHVGVRDLDFLIHLPQLRHFSLHSSGQNVDLYPPRIPGMEDRCPLPPEQDPLERSRVWDFVQSLERHSEHRFWSGLLFTAPSLETLDISDCPSAALPFIGRLPKLTHLHLRWSTSLSSDSVRSLSEPDHNIPIPKLYPDSESEDPPHPLSQSLSTPPRSLEGSRPDHPVSGCEFQSQSDERKETEHDDTDQMTTMRLRWLDLGLCIRVSQEALQPLLNPLRTVHLQVLSLSCLAQVVDLSPLSGPGVAPHLQVLILDGCSGLTDLEFLADCRNLRLLNLSGCTGIQGGWAALESLIGLPNLRTLDLSDCPWIGTEVGFSESQPSFSDPDDDDDHDDSDGEDDVDDAAGSVLSSDYHSSSSSSEEVDDAECSSESEGEGSGTDGSAEDVVETESEMEEDGELGSEFDSDDLDAGHERRRARVFAEARRQMHQAQQEAQAEEQNRMVKWMANHLPVTLVRVCLEGSGLEMRHQEMIVEQINQRRREHCLIRFQQQQNVPGDLWQQLRRFQASRRSPAAATGMGDLRSSSSGILQRQQGQQSAMMSTVFAHHPWERPRLAASSTEHDFQTSRPPHQELARSASVLDTQLSDNRPQTTQHGQSNTSGSSVEDHERRPSLSGTPSMASRGLLPSPSSVSSPNSPRASGGESTTTASSSPSSATPHYLSRSSTLSTASSSSILGSLGSLTFSSASEFDSEDLNSPASVCAPWDPLWEFLWDTHSGRCELMPRFPRAIFFFTKSPFVLSPKFT